MSYKVHWLDEAIADMRDIILYVSEQFGSGTATKIIDKIESDTQMLAHSPLIGVTYGPRPGYRVIRSKRNSVYYRIEENEAIVTAVCDNRRSATWINTILDIRKNK